MMEKLTETLSILILEDDDSFAKALSVSLSNKGHQVSVASSIEGLSKLINDSQDWHLMLLDLKLKDDTSLPYIAQFRALMPNTKIIMITGFASIATTVEAIKQGADDYLPKPVNVNDILQAYYGKKTEAEAELMSPKRLEWEHIQRVLQENDGNISRTAKQLNMHRRTLQRKLQKKPQQT